MNHPPQTPGRPVPFYAERNHIVETLANHGLHVQWGPRPTGRERVHDGADTCVGWLNHSDFSPPFFEANADHPLFATASNLTYDDGVDRSARRPTDGTDEGAERALRNESPEAIQTFLAEEVEARVAAATLPLLAKVKELKELQKGGILARPNTILRENGSQRKFSAPVAVALEQDLVQISSENGADPRILTVALSKVNATLAPVGSNHRLYARIRWGAGKAKNMVLIDYKQGLRVTVDASSIEVSAVYDAWAFPAVGPDVYLGAQVIEGSIGTPTAQATFTLGGLDVLTSAKTVFDIPSFASRLTILGTTDGPYTVVFSQENAKPGGGTVYAGVTVLNPNESIIIPGGAESVIVENNNMATDTLLAIFGLNF